MGFETKNRYQDVMRFILITALLIASFALPACEKPPTEDTGTENGDGGCCNDTEWMDGGGD